MRLSFCVDFIAKVTKCISSPAHFIEATSLAELEEIKRYDQVHARVGSQRTQSRLKPDRVFEVVLEMCIFKLP